MSEKKLTKKGQEAIRKRFVHDLFIVLTGNGPETLLQTTGRCGNEVVLKWGPKAEDRSQYRMQTRLVRVDGTQDDVTKAFGPPLDEQDFLETTRGITTGIISLLKVASVSLVLTSAFVAFIVWQIWG